MVRTNGYWLTIAANIVKLDADEKYFKEHGEPLFSSHMIDLSEESVEFNISTTEKYLKRAAPMKQWLEMEIGITGGEEDGVNNGNTLLLSIGQKAGKTDAN